MNAQTQSVVFECTRGSDEGSLTFGEVVGKLIQAGVEQYYADLRRDEKIYYMPDGTGFTTPARRIGVEPAFDFDPTGVETAIRAIQARQIDYHGFCRQIMAAGCVGYIVSLAGRRAVYFGRTAELYVEPFPQHN